MSFEAVNVAGDPEAAQELQRLGVPLVPAVAVGKRVVHGWNPRGFAALLDIPDTPVPQLSPTELAKRLDRILLATQRTVRQVPPELLEIRTPGRERDIRDLSYHIFRLSLAFRDAAVQQCFPEAWLLEPPPSQCHAGAGLVEYGISVREQLARWFAANTTVSFSCLVETYYGLHSLHALRERTTWHAAQHLRQIHALLEERGVTPEHPLREEDYAGLPLPSALW